MGCGVILPTTTLSGAVPSGILECTSTMLWGQLAVVPSIHVRSAAMIFLIPSLAGQSLSSNKVFCAQTGGGGFQIYSM